MCAIVNVREKECEVLRNCGEKSREKKYRDERQKEKKAIRMDQKCVPLRDSPQGLIRTCERDRETKKGAKEKKKYAGKIYIICT